MKVVIYYVRFSCLRNVASILIFIVFFFLLTVSASHYHHTPNSYHTPTTIMEGVVHSVHASHHPHDRRSSSVHSLQNFFTTTKPSSATSFPHLQQLTNLNDSRPNKIEETTIVAPPTTTSTNPNTLLPSSTGKNHHLAASLCRIDGLYSRRTSIPANRPKEDRLPYFRQKSLDESTISTPVSKTTDTTALEINESQQKTDKPTEIRVRCIFSRVGEIDTLNERYTAEIFFEASWYDREQQHVGQYDPQLAYFNPQLVVLNHIGDTLRHEVSR